MFRGDFLTIFFVFLTCLCFNRAKAQNIYTTLPSNLISACAADAVYPSNLTKVGFSANSLSADLEFTISPNFQVSLDGVTFGSSAKITPSGGIASGTAYIRTTTVPAMGSTSGWLKLNSDIWFTTVPLKTVVNELPTANAVTNQTLTAGAATAAVDFSGTTKGFTWINNTPAIGLPASGAGNIPSFTALNPGTSVLTATITVTPVNTGYIYVPNTYSDNVSVVNPVGNYVVATIPVGIGPLKTIVSRDGNFVYVLNNQSSSISIINTVNNTVVADILINKPIDMQLKPQDDFLYVTTEGGTVALVNLSQWNVYKYLQVGLGSHTSYMSPDGHHYYVSNPAANTITVIDTWEMAVEATIPNMDNAYRFVTSPDGTRMYVSDLTASTVSVINTATNTIIATIPVANYPSDLAISPDGSRVYAAGADASAVSVINTATNTVIATIPVGQTPVGLSISPDGKTLYATSQFAQNVSVINTATNTVTATISVPGTLAYPSLSPDGKILYIVDLPGRFINVFSTTNNTLVTKVAVGTFPALFDQSISSGTGCIGSPITFTVTVNPAPPATLTVNESLAGFTTTYGTASATQNINLSSSGGPFLVTSPTGFEVSADGVTYSSTVNIGSAAGFTGLPVYIRLAALTNAGTYTGNIVISHPQISQQVLIPNSTVNPAPLTFTASDANKRYGEVLANYTGPNGFTLTSGNLKNGNTIASADFVYGPAKGATFGVGTYSNSVTITGITGANGYLAGNYTLSYLPGSIHVLSADLIIIPDDASKVYGGAVPTNRAFGVIGLKNNETLLSISYIYTAGGAATDNAGTYLNAIQPTDPTGGTFNITNYNITYRRSTLTITPAVLTVTANNATKNYRQVNPPFSVRYSGFVNGDSEAQLSKLPVIASAATVSSGVGEYPISASGAVALNYIFIYVDGVLTVTSASTLAVPNTFTPNNDGINDTWNLPALAAYPTCTVDIFNRYGVKVYSSVGYSMPWDGTTKGGNVPAGTYYFIIDTKSAASRIAGNLTVVR